MSFPPPPNNRFAPPPGRTFAPPTPGSQSAAGPPGGQAAGGFAPPPANNGGFAPPPPGGGFSAPPAGGGFAPPPPGGSALNNGMANMSINQPPAAGAGRGFGPPPPGQQQQPPANGFAAPGQPPANQFAPPAANSFAPPGQGGGFAPPGGSGPTTPGSIGSRPKFQPGPGGAAPPPPGVSPGGGGGNFYQGAAAPPGAPAGMATPGMAPLVNENIDYNVTVPDSLIRWTCGKLPQTANMATSSKIPFGATLRPLGPEPVDTVQPGTAGIVRCKRCRTYINAFVSWSEHGRRWRCNICGQVNECPSAYFCHLDEKGLRRDRFERPELSKSVVEFVAPAEYMVRAPQEPTYFFVLDVTAPAIRCGMLKSAARAIKASLDNLPGGVRTKVGFITFDNTVHYYNLAPELKSPQMMVVPDLKELFVPLPDNLLANLQESRSVIDAFLDSLPDMFSAHPVVSHSCLGPALKAAFTVMKQIGGKMSVFQSILPNLGDGALKPRENPGLMGTPNEMKVLKPETFWYKDTAVEFSKQQISVDMYLFPYSYMDLAALGDLARYSAGTMRSYVSFTEARDSPRFEGDLQKTLTQTTAFEAVMRIRCTKGMRITNFYGNFWIRGTDLLALPNCNTESVFGFEIAHDEQNVNASHVTVQAALLYTSSEGERRIRVMTQALPVSGLTSEVVGSVNSEAACALMAKQALEVAKNSSLDNARMRMQQICVEVIRTAKGGDQRKVSGYSVPPSAQGGSVEQEEKPIPESLKMLPTYTLAMMKNVAFRGGTDVHPDERVQSHHTLNSMWSPDTKNFLYPRMFSIHDMPGNAGVPATADVPGDLVAGNNRILLPNAVNLSADRLSSNGVFLLDNGVEMYLWVGSTADLTVVSSLFGVHSLDDMDPSQLIPATTGDPLAIRFGAIVQALREDESDDFVVPPKINVIREGCGHLEARFYWFLIEDRSGFQGGTHSLEEFVQFVNNPQASSGNPPAPGRGAPPGPGRGPQGPPGQPMPSGAPRGMAGPPGAPSGPPGAPNMPGPSAVPNMPPPGRAMPPGNMPPPPGQGMPGPPGAPAMGHGMSGPPGAPTMPGQQMNMPPMARQPAPSGMPPPAGRAAPGGMPPPPGRAMPGQSAAAPAANGPPSAGPPSGGFGGPPPSAGPPSGGFGGPPSGGPPSGGFSAPPPGRSMAPPPGRAMPPPPGGTTPPARRAMPPPPPRGAMPPPPPR